MLNCGGMAQLAGVVSDLDGTLLRSDGALSPESIRFLRSMRELGVPLVVATGRTPRAVCKVVGYEHLGRVVCANGAIVWDAGRDEVVHQCCFDPAELSAAVARLRAALPEAGVALLSARTMFVDQTYVALRGKRAGGAQAFSDVDHVLSVHLIAMVAVRHPRLRAEEVLAPAAEAFGGTGVASFAGLDVVDITPTQTSKAVAVAREMAALGCAPEATVVFGDMPNDLPLFDWAGWACAVANAHPRVLEAADEVVPSNDADGVARTVGRLLRP
jgi:Cof subfamily protein (haloacid dehalogenase superfamily)